MKEYVHECNALRPFIRRIVNTGMSASLRIWDIMGTGPTFFGHITISQRKLTLVTGQRTSRCWLARPSPENFMAGRHPNLTSWAAPTGDGRVWSQRRDFPRILTG